DGVVAELRSDQLPQPMIVRIRLRHSAAPVHRGGSSPKFRGEVKGGIARVEGAQPARELGASTNARAEPSIVCGAIMPWRTASSASSTSLFTFSFSKIR